MTSNVNSPVTPTMPLKIMRRDSHHKSSDAVVRRSAAGGKSISPSMVTAAAPVPGCSYQDSQRRIFGQVLFDVKLSRPVGAMCQHDAGRSGSETEKLGVVSIDRLVDYPHR